MWGPGSARDQCSLGVASQHWALCRVPSCAPRVSVVGRWHTQACIGPGRSPGPTSGCNDVRRDSLNNLMWPAERIGRRGREPAFTLVELLVVIAIVAVLTAILFPSSRRRRKPPRRPTASPSCGSSARRSHSIGATTTTGSPIDGTSKLNWDTGRGPPGPYLGSNFGPSMRFHAARWFWSRLPTRSSWRLVPRREPPSGRARGSGSSRR